MGMRTPEEAPAGEILRGVLWAPLARPHPLRPSPSTVSLRRARQMVGLRRRCREVRAGTGMCGCVPSGATRRGRGGHGPRRLAISVLTAHYLGLPRPGLPCPHSCG